MKLSWCGGNPILCCDTKNAAPSNVVAQSSKAVALSWALLPLPPGLTPTEEQAIAEGALGTAEGSRARGAAALALIGAATAIALDEARRRREEEARQREEMERRNTAQRAREEAERARIAAAALAAEETARAAQDRRTERREQRLEEQEIAARERAEAEARAQREAEAEARRLALATAQGDRLRSIAEGRDEPPLPTVTPTATATPTSPGTPTAFPTATLAPSPTSPLETPTLSATPTVGPSVTATPSSTASATPDATATPTPSTTSTPYWEAWLTPQPTHVVATPVPGLAATAIAEMRIEARVTESGVRLLSGMDGLGWPRNYQWPGIVSSGLNLIAWRREVQGAPESETRGWRLGARVADYGGSLGLATTSRIEAGLPSVGQAVREAVQAVSQPGVSSRSGAVWQRLQRALGRELSEMGGRVVPRVTSVETLAIRGLQSVAAIGGVIAGGFQVAEGVQMLGNEDRYDNMLGIAEGLGGLATIGGSAITFGAALGLITMPVVIGAAPVLLGIGAIAAAGVFVYNLARDTAFPARVEAFANQPGGFTDAAIGVGRAVVSGARAVRGFFSGLFGGGSD